MLPAPPNPKYQNTVSPKDTPHKIRFLSSHEQKKKQKFIKIKFKKNSEDQKKQTRNPQEPAIFLLKTFNSTTGMSIALPHTLEHSEKFPCVFGSVNIPHTKRGAYTKVIYRHKMLLTLKE
jgi:hypothetical protein